MELDMRDDSERESVLQSWSQTMDSLGGQQLTIVAHSKELDGESYRKQLGLPDDPPEE